ncbi:MAG: hypothetical protein ACTSRK_09325 [Promethearchaeota archaeon]
MITEDIDHRTTNLATTHHLVDRNGEIVRLHLIARMKESFNIGSQLIEQELNGMASIFRPIIKSFYANLVQKDLEYGTIKSINGMIKLTKKMVLNGVEINSPEFEKLILQKFPAYLKNDQTGRQCRPTHRNYSRLRENLKDTFRAQIQGMMPLLQVQQKSISSYPELCRKAFSSAEECKITLKWQTDAMQKAQAIITEDLSILNIITGKELIFRVLERGFKIKINDFNKDIEKIFAQDK